jgi:hypothetical protein
MIDGNQPLKHILENSVHDIKRTLKWNQVSFEDDMSKKDLAKLVKQHCGIPRVSPNAANVLTI